MSFGRLPGFAAIILLALAGLAHGQPARFGPSPDARPLQAFTGAVGPFEGSREQRVYLAIYEPALGAQGVVAEVLGRLNEPGLLRLAPHEGSGLAPLEARLSADELLDLWRVTVEEFDADFGRAEAHFEAFAAKAGPPPTPCEPNRLVAFIGGGSTVTRRSQGEETYCAQPRWWISLAPRLRTLAIAHFPGCAGLSANGPWSELARCLKR